MISTYKNHSRGIVWLDLENPSMEEIRSLVIKYEIDPIVANDLLRPSLKPHIEYHDKYIYIVLHFPILDSLGKKIENKIEEIDFILGKNFIITTRYNPVDAVLGFAKLFETNSIIERNEKNEKQTSYSVFSSMIKSLYKSLIDHLEYVVVNLKTVESKIFENREIKMVEKISEINRHLLSFRGTTIFHREILESLERNYEKFFVKLSVKELDGLIREYLKVENTFNGVKDYLDELRDTNDSLIHTSQNEIMKNLTVMAFLMLPLTLITSIFGMSSQYIPIVQQENGFFVILSILFLVAAFLFLFFRFKKWL